MEEGSDQVMPYMVRCQVAMGDLADSEMQLTFVKDMMANPMPEMNLAEAQIAWRLRGDTELAISHLDTSLETHMSQIGNLPHDVDYFWLFNPDLLLEISREVSRKASN